MFPLALVICSILVVERGESLNINPVNNHFSRKICNKQAYQQDNVMFAHRNRMSTTSSSTILHMNADISCYRLHSISSLDLRCQHCNRKIYRDHACTTSSHSTTRLMSSSKQDEIDSNDDSTTTYIDDDNEIVSNHSTKFSTDDNKWEANNYKRDKQLLQAAISKHNAISNLQQLQRKYILDYGFANNKRPLVHDVLTKVCKIGLFVCYLISSGSCCSVSSGISGVMHAWNNDPTTSLLSKLHMLTTSTIISMSTIHYWTVCVTLPLLLLALVKYDKLGAPSRTLDEYFKPPQSTDDTPSFFYTVDASKKKRVKDKDTGNFVMCLLENWSSSIITTFSLGLYSMLVSLIKKQRGFIGSSSIYSSINTIIRLITRVGAAASLYQYPSLLFELRRKDQPGPLCRQTSYMQKTVKMFLHWLPLGIASDLTLLLLGTRRQVGVDSVKFGSIMTSLVSLLPRICQLIALGRITRISKCSAISLSESTSFPANSKHLEEEDTRTIDNRRKVKWRYQLRWRTPVRIAETIRSWSNYLFTGHESLLYDMDDWKKQPLKYDDFSTEGTHYLMQNDDRDSKDKRINNTDDNGDLIPHADAIVESLSLIFRDRDAAIQNATQARLAKHQDSYDTKALDDVLGIAVQQSFDVGISYDFDHFAPKDGDEIDIHQLRARMAKSAVRRKKELDNTMKREVDTLHRLKESVATDMNNNEAELEMKTVERGIRERHAREVDEMRDSLLTLIPTNADMPKGTSDQYDNPIMVAEYVDLKAPFERSTELITSIESAPDSLEIIEDYVRRDFGDEAADAYRRDEIVARVKEKEMLSQFRDKYGELNDDNDDEK